MKSLKKITLSICCGLFFCTMFAFVVPQISNTRLEMSVADWYAHCRSKQSGLEGHLMEFIDRTNFSFALWFYPSTAELMRSTCLDIPSAR